MPTGPSYAGIASSEHVCSTVGSVPGINFVRGADYLAQSYEYYNKNKWRNWGISVAYAVFFLGVYIALTEFNKGAMQKGEIVLFLRGSLQKIKDGNKQNKHAKNDIESGVQNEKIDFNDSSESGRESSSDLEV